MKKMAISLISGTLLLSNFACKKNEIELPELASLNVVAAVIGGGNVKLNSVVRDSAKAYNARVFGLIPGNDILLYPTNSPSTVYFQKSKTTPVEAGGIYSVFLCGQAPNFDGIFVKDNVPDFYSDSSVGVRIVNLSPNSSPVNVTIQSNIAANVLSCVKFKDLTDVIKFPVITVTPTASVTFQVRSAASPATVLATYTLPANVNNTYPGISINLQRFKNITLVIKGLQGTTSGNDAFGIFPVAMS